jgi:hypothetical protein
MEMSAIPYENERKEWDGVEEEQTLAFPTRPRRQFVTRGSMALLAVVTCAAGFYAGIRVEKGQLSNSSSTSSLGGTAGRLAAAFASRLGGASGRSGGGSPGTLSSSFGAGNSSFGTVSSVSGNAIYVTETASGNVIKVTLSSATKITKNVGVGKSAIRPGDTVVVQGVKGTGGAISATSLSDSGARSAGGGGGGGFSALFGGGGGGAGAAGGSGGGGGGAAAGGSGGGSGGGGAAVNSLFGRGGG